MPQTFQPGIIAPANPSPEAWAFLVHALDLVLSADVTEVRLPRLCDLGERPERLHFLGMLDGVECYAAALDDPALPDGFVRVPTRRLFDRVDPVLFAVAGRALAIAEWDVQHRFCGRCGTATDGVAGERVKKCPGCAATFYPRISPAVIVLIERDDSVLLARNATFPRPWFSTLAGFVEPGESLEETVVREVREEVGVEVGDLRYFGSQPWPFGRSLMVGFNARYLSGEIVCDAKEIAEARFFHREAMPDLPMKISIARSLIDAWLSKPRS